MDGLSVDGLISLSHSLNHIRSHSHSHTLIHEGGGASRRLHTGWRRFAPPPCVDSLMDGCVAVSLAVAETVAVAVAEINPSTINPPAI